MVKRVFSALAAATVLFLSAYFGQANGVAILCGLVAVGSIFEYSRLTLGTLDASEYIRLAFLILTLISELTIVFFGISGMAVLPVAVILFATIILISIRTVDDLRQGFLIHTSGTLGFLYVGVFPALVIRLLFFENGLKWFFGFLLIVFAGDTFAYFSGILFGRHKLHEVVSPKKTIEGAIGSLVGSSAAGFLLHTALPDSQLVFILLLSITTGVFAQIGDLFESQLKRIAGVKDSGSIMPGHGGVLDRLDGVLFSAPVFYLLLTCLH